MNHGDDNAVRVLVAGGDARFAEELEAATGSIRGMWISRDQCDSCHSALDRLMGGTYDLCLAVEPLSGASAMEFIRSAVARGCRTPLIQIGHDSGPEAVADAMEAGAADHLGREELTAPLLERSFRYALEGRRLEEEMAALLSAASESARAKAQFIATISHEFKTPLSAAIGMIDLVLDSELTEKQHDDLMLARVSADSLLGLMNNILDWSSLQSGKIAMQSRFFHLRELLGKVLSPLHAAAAQKSLRLASRVDPEVPEKMFGDPERLSQVITHLVANAIKFTDEGEVTLAVAVQEGADPLLQWSVADTGPGIPAERIHTIFRPFTQVDGSSTRRHGGIGLGLSMVRDLVSLLGGKIWVESEPGKGTSFHFTARLIPAQADPKPESHRPAGRALVCDPVSPHILAADDSLVNQMLLTDILQKAGYRVTLVDNGCKAVAATERERFVAVLMDLQMPEMDGYEAVRAIRKREAATGGHIPIFALTGSEDEHELERCRQAGMDGCLKKPYREDELLALLADACRGGAAAGDAEAPAAEGGRSAAGHPCFGNLHATFGGNAEAIHEFVGYFLQEGSAQLQNIRCGLAVGDEALIEQSAHKLKGMAANVGATGMADDAFRIQLAVRKGDFATPQEIIDRLEEMLKEMQSCPERRVGDECSMEQE